MGPAGSEIVKERETSDASAYEEFPAAFAFNVQVPAVSIVTSSPTTVQTSSVVDVRMTAKLASDVAVTRNGFDDNSRSAGRLKDSVWIAIGLTIADAGDTPVVV